MLSLLAILVYANQNLTKGSDDISTRNHPQTYNYAKTKSSAFTKKVIFAIIRT